MHLAPANVVSLREGMMSKSCWMRLSLGALALLGCTRTRTTPNIVDANVSALLGAPTFAGKWRCTSDRLSGTRWYEFSATSCNFDDSSGTTSTQVHTIIGHDGHVQLASRDWWNRDSSEWVARRDSISRAVLVRFPSASRCHGPPAGYAPLPQPPQAGTIRDQRAWRTPGYDVEISTLGPATSADNHGRPIYVLSLNVATAPGWMFDCATETQLSRLPRHNRGRVQPDTGRQR